jgi:hypothetical protein
MADKPEWIRSLYPFLHKYKKASFAAWLYKLRTSMRSNDVIKAPSESAIPKKAPAKALQVAVPQVISVADPGAKTVVSTKTTKTVTPEASTYRAFNSNSAKKRKTTNDDDEDDSTDHEVTFNIDHDDPLSMKLPYRIAKWDDDQLKLRYTIIIWMLSGAYQWDYEQKTSYGVLRLCWPNSFHEKVFTHSFKGSSSTKNRYNREHGIESSLREVKTSSNSSVWSVMYIPMPSPVIEESEIRFLDAKGLKSLLGRRYIDFPFDVHDRFMTIDLKTPAKGYKAKAVEKTCFIDLEDMDSDDEGFGEESTNY